MAVIEIIGLTKSYGKTQALCGIDLSVKQGEVHGFIGMNGAGKSTTIRILLGMLKKDGGEVKLLDGDPFKDCVELHKRLAYIPSEINPWPDLSGGEVIDLLSRMRGKPDSKRRAELIERFQFDPSKKCRTYSKGNRQKVALIAALVSDVELYIFDEPTSGLDPLMESVFQDYVREMATRGKTVFLSSHILTEVEKLCDRVTIIKEGRIVESGSLLELQQFSRLVVHVECTRPVTGIQLPGVYGLRCEGNMASFSVNSAALNASLKKLTEYKIVSLHCAPPELEDLFLHYYAKGGEVQ
ncbi:ABC transporter ATP-binding protein [Desulfosporosinus sp. Sb-LF]|uniref:ABC transporter ATP-binding protein n=1 Tax=Desulfosporosinus sp. Sb-LF TaxID=2560027 RepID=UPI00107FA61F|nr:ABC transporter ATP-binding protein [Desulfosporosinus sp. Sb-LF]TGE31069.1 ABC transporter ATP-binding protein [Desulfosporosinus sp. Sb-LF]